MSGSITPSGWPSGVQAGSYAPPQTNMLGMVTTVQDLINKRQELLNMQEQNKQIQANTALTGTRNTGEQLDQVGRRMMIQGQVAGAAATDPTQWTPTAVRSLIAKGVVDHSISPQEAAVYSQQIATIGDDPKAIQNLLLTHAHQAMTVADQIKAATGEMDYVRAADGSVVPMRKPAPNQQVLNPGSAVTNAGTPLPPGMTAVEQTEMVGIPDEKGGTRYFFRGQLQPDGKTPLANAQPIEPASENMINAFRSTEGSRNGQVSTAGARGELQITPGFFKQYAHAGESFDSYHDIEQVGRRGIAALNAQYPNDPARVATAYFSGNGNVAPAGSANPWIDDTSDGATKTSGYVSRFLQKYQTSKTSPASADAATKSAAADSSGLPKPVVYVPPMLQAQNETDFKNYQESTSRFNSTDAPLIANYREAYNLGRTLATGKGTELGADLRDRVVNLGRAIGVDTGTMTTQAQARAELDKVLNQILLQTPSARRSDLAQLTTQSGSPNLTMNTNAMLNQIRILYGQAKWENAAMAEHDPATRGLPSKDQPGFTERDRNMRLNTAREGFMSDLMSKDEIQARLKTLGGEKTPAGQAFLNGILSNARIWKNNPGSSLLQ